MHLYNTKIENIQKTRANRSFFFFYMSYSDSPKNLLEMTISVKERIFFEILLTCDIGKSFLGISRFVLIDSSRVKELVRSLAEHVLNTGE